MMPESEAIVKQCSMRKVALIWNMFSIERHDSQSEIGLNQKNLEADTVRSRLEHLTIMFIYHFLRQVFITVGQVLFCTIA